MVARLFLWATRWNAPTQDIKLSHHLQLLVHSLSFINGTFWKIRRLLS